MHHVDISSDKQDLVEQAELKQDLVEQAELLNYKLLSDITRWEDTYISELAELDKDQVENYFYQQINTNLPLLQAKEVEQHNALKHILKNIFIGIVIFGAPVAAAAICSYIFFGNPRHARYVNATGQLDETNSSIYSFCEEKSTLPLNCSSYIENCQRLPNPCTFAEFEKLGLGSSKYQALDLSFLYSMLLMLVSQNNHPESIEVTLPIVGIFVGSLLVVGYFLCGAADHLDDNLQLMEESRNIDDITIDIFGTAENNNSENRKIENLLPALTETKHLYFNRYSLFACSEQGRRLPKELHRIIFSFFDKAVSSDIKKRILHQEINDSRPNKRAV